RDFQGAGHDGAVGGPAADFGDKGQDLGFVHLGSVGGGQIVGEDHRRFGHVAQGTRFNAQEVVNPAGTDVPDVGGPAPHVLIVHGVKHAGKGLPGLVDGHFGVSAFVDFGNYGFAEHGVVQQHEVGIEDGGFTFSGFGGQ